MSSGRQYASWQTVVGADVTTGEPTAVLVPATPPPSPAKPESILAKIKEKKNLPYTIGGALAILGGAYWFLKGKKRR